MKTLRLLNSRRIIIKKKLFGTLAVAALTFVGLAPIAGADPAPENIVTLGDSYLANPSFDDTRDSLIRTTAGIQMPLGREVGDFDRVGGERANMDSCPKGDVDLSIPKQLQLKTGTRVYDYSCASTTLYTQSNNSWTLLERTALAIEEGALNENTSFVPITAGFNDTYKPNTVTDDKANRAQKFAQAIDEVIATIRAAAPNARIVLMDYPTISEEGTDRQCLIHRTDKTTGIPAIWIAEGEQNMQEFMRDASVRNGTEFLDVREMTHGMGECAPDDVRIISGVIDETGEDYNLGAHMNTRGVALVSNALVDTYRR